MLIISLPLDLYPASQGPRYWQANVANVAFSASCIALATTLRFYLSRRNKALDRATDNDSAEALAQKWQCHPDYRYAL
jgi:hypothetical protein